jgi:hypothetical protein
MASKWPAEIERTQWLPREGVEAYQAKRLNQLLQTALAHSPWHADRIRASGLEAAVWGGTVTLSDLPGLPTMTKRDARENVERLVWRNVPGGVFKYTTGGSSGEPLIFYFGRQRQASDAAGRMRARHWWGVAPGERAPILVQVNGLDSTKEMHHLVGLPRWLAQRGVSSLVVDQPGTGEALRLHGMTARFDAEHWASRVVDWLETRDDVDPKRIGCEGVSLGGYYCPRAVAMEPRFAAGVCWGANHDWRDVQKKRLQKEGDFPVPHYWAHVCWVWGAENIDDLAHRRGRAPGWRGREDPRPVPRHARREGLADPIEVGAPHLRAAHQQPEARAQGLHRSRRRRAARQLRQQHQRRPLHRRLGGRGPGRPHRRCGRLNALHLSDKELT